MANDRDVREKYREEAYSIGHWREEERLPALPLTARMMPLVAVLAAALACPVRAETSDASSGEMARAAAFFKGRAVTLIGGATPDGGDEQQDRVFSGMTIVARGDEAAPAAGRDAAARLVARHLGRHVPGAPSVSFVTLPGAAGPRPPPPPPPAPPPPAPPTRPRG
ncbi:MAG: hypothetical protein ACK4NA_16755, partial [Alphaproteobacteria bacterium]